MFLSGLCLSDRILFEQSLVPCVCVSERNLLADTAKIIERHKINKRKDGFCRKTVADGLTALGYDASICKSKWEKSSSFLAGKKWLILCSFVSPVNHVNSLVFIKFQQGNTSMLM